MTRPKASAVATMPSLPVQPVATATPQPNTTSSMVPTASARYFFISSIMTSDGRVCPPLFAPLL